MKHYLFKITFTLFILGSAVQTGWVQPSPVDCDAAIPVCNSQQLDYNSNGPGMNDFTGQNSNSNGCLFGGEHQSAWFKIYISPNSPPGATLAFTISPNGGAGEDYDFALYGPDVSCDNLGTPLRCSYAASGCLFCPDTGLGMGTSDFSEGAGGDGFVAEVQTQPGETYILLVDNWLASNQGFFLSWTGNAVLSCDCVADVSIDGDLEVCPGETTTLTAIGQDLVSYSWTASNGGNISGPTDLVSITATSPGTYTVSVTDSEDCTAELSVDVVSAPGPEIQASITPTTCGQDNGAIDLTISGDGAPYSFNWSNGATTEDLQDIATGNYTVTVTGDNGCSNTASFSVTNEDQNIVIDGNVNPNTSCTGGTGSIEVTMTPPGDYTFNWSNGSMTQDIMDLTGGEYTLIVTSEDGCTASATFNVPHEPDIPILSASTTSSTCGLPNGAIDLTVSLGAPPFTFNWSNGETTEDLDAVSAGTYIVTVTGDNGCTNELSITVDNQNPPININATIDPNTSCDQDNGSIVIDVSPSNPSYTYSWSNGATTQNLTDVSSGEYTVTVSGVGSCTGEATFTIPDEPTVPILDVQTVPPFCDLSNGSIDISVSGGSSPFTFNWSNGAVTEDLEDVPAGQYDLTVTGSNGCTSTLSVILENQNPDITIDPVVIPNTTCDGGNGSISITVTPSGNYNYNWSNGDNTKDIDGLLPGNYTVTVDGEGNCDQVATFNVPDQPDKPLISENINPASCGESNGSIDITVSGGVEPYSFIWNTGSTTEDLFDIPGGTYSLTVTGDNGCSETANITVPDNTINFTLDEDISPNTNCLAGGFNGSISLVLTPSGNYTYEWSNGGTGPAITGLEGGTYAVTVSAGGSCIQTATYTVPDEPILPQISESVEPAGCDLSNGAIDLTIAGGIPPYTFNWSDGSTTEDLTGIPAGTYAVTVTAENGCTSTADITVPNNDLLIDISGNTVPNTSCTNANGAVDIFVTPSGNSYTYAWSNGETTEDIFNLEAGTYTVTVSIGSCMATASFDVVQSIEQPEISVDVEAATCGEPNGSIDLTVSGGQPPYSYTWSNGATTEDLSDILPGIYSVTVLDGNGCTVESAFQVQNNSSNFSISGSTDHVTNCLYQNGAIDLSVVPAGNYDFIWSNGADTEDIDSLPPGDYSVTVTQSGNCSGSAFFTVEDQTSSPMITADISPEICGLSNGSIDVSLSGGVTPYTYNWSNGALTEDLSGVATGNYDLTVMDGNACTSEVSYSVPENNKTFTVDAAIVPDTSCDIKSGAISLTVSPVDSYTFEWSTGDTTNSVNGLAGGPYAVTVSVGGNCTTTEMYNVPIDRPEIDITASTTDVLCFGESSGTIELTVEGGTPPYTYQWNPMIPGGPQDPVGLQAGEYEVVVSDKNGCTGMTNASIGGPSDSLEIVCNTTSHVSTPGGTDGAGTVDINGGTPPYVINWNSGDSTGLNPGLFEIDKLGVGNYNVTVTDANGCVVFCGFTVEEDECETRVGAMSVEVFSDCGNGCITASYDDSDQQTGSGDGLQFILHHGSGSQIIDEITRNTNPEFCFDSTEMQFGETYYVSAVVGPEDGSGDILLDHSCTKIAPGSPIVFHRIPDVQIARPDTLNCEQGEIVLTGSSSLGGVEYLWTTSDGTILGDPGQPAVTVASGGMYVLEVKRNGCINTAHVFVLDISREIEAQIEANPGDTIDCSVSTVSLTGSADGTDDAAFRWYFEGNYISDKATIFTETPGEYRLTVVDTITFCSDSDSLTVADNADYPILQLDSPPVLNCRDTEVTVTGNSPNQDIDLSWVSIEGTDTILIDTGPSSRIDEAGTYHLFGMAPNGCENSISFTVKEEKTPPSVDAGADVTLDCHQNPVEISATASQGASYAWSGPAGGIISGQADRIVTVDRTGSYILTVTDPNNYCTNRDTVEVFQYENVPRAEIDVQSPTCAGDSNGSIFIESDPEYGPYRYHLNGQDHGSTQTISPLAPGTYTLEVTDAEGCSWTTSVQVPEAKPLEVEFGENILVEEGETAMITLELSVPLSTLDTIVWTPSSMFSCDDRLCTSQEFMPEHETDIRVTIIDTNGCSATDALTVFVKKTRKVYVPNVFSPNGDGTNDVFMIYSDDKVERVHEFVIFDRWGERLFERRDFQPNDPIYGWNGTYRGERMSPAVFVWYAVVEFEDGTTVQFRGDVTLIL